eukprot:9775777-Prorocentrum_lima.AAC.1
MTSSLVGSEMCIRDRFPTGWVWAWAATAVAGWLRWQGQAAFWERLTTVSYTHLTLPTICSV